MDGPDTKSEPGATEVIDEVGMSRRSAARDQADPKRHQREEVVAVGVQQAIGGESGEDLLAVEFAVRR